MLVAVPGTESPRAFIKRAGCSTPSRSCGGARPFARDQLSTKVRALPEQAVSHGSIACVGEVVDVTGDGGSLPPALDRDQGDEEPARDLAGAHRLGRDVGARRRRKLGGEHLARDERVARRRDDARDEARGRRASGRRGRRARPSGRARARRRRRAGGARTGGPLGPAWPGATTTFAGAEPPE